MKAEREWMLFYWAGNILFLGGIAYSFFLLDNILWAFVPLAANLVWIYCWCTLPAFQPVKNKESVR